MNFLLLQHQDICPGTKWILQQEYPHYAIKVREFPYEMDARAFHAQFRDNYLGCALVPDKLSVLCFKGIADGGKVPVTANYRADFETLMDEVALWWQVYR